MNHPVIRGLLNAIELSPDPKNASCAPDAIDRAANLLRTDYKKDISAFVELTAVWSAFSTKGIEPISSQLLTLLEIVKESDPPAKPAPVRELRPAIPARATLGAVKLGGRS